MAHSALQRRESRGAHQRLDGFEQRDDVNFLKHSQAHYVAGGPPRIDYGPVKITKSQPATRAQSEFHAIAAGAIIVLLVLLLSLNATAVLLRNRFQRRW